MKGGQGQILRAARRPRVLQGFSTLNRVASTRRGNGHGCAERVGKDLLLAMRSLLSLPLAAGRCGSGGLAVQQTGLRVGACMTAMTHRGWDGEGTYSDEG